MNLQNITGCRFCKKHINHIKSFHARTNNASVAVLQNMTIYANMIKHYLFTMITIHQPHAILTYAITHTLHVQEIKLFRLQIRGKMKNICTQQQQQQQHQQQPVNGPLAGTTQVSWYQKSKTDLDLLEQETVGGSGLS